MRHFLVFALLLTLTGFAGAAPAQGKLTLAEAYRFDGRAIGFGGTASDNYEAFEAELAKGEAARPTFEKLVKSGTPAAKIYSALGLYGLDKARGTAALKGLLGDESPLKAMNGCMLDESTVAKVAKSLLDDPAEISVYVPSARAGQ